MVGDESARYQRYGAKTKDVPGRNLGDWIIFRVHLRVSSRGTYLQSRVRREDRDGEAAWRIKRARRESGRRVEDVAQMQPAVT